MSELKTVWVLPSEVKDYGVPEYSVAWRNKLISEGLHPPAYRLSANRIAFKREDLELYANHRPLAGDPLPQLWPARQVPLGRGLRHYKEDGVPGRPRGSKLGPKDPVTGKRKLILPEQGVSDAAD